MSKIIVNTLDKKNKINRNIYGNFSEHLGRCIYNGVYVGENSDIPNVNGMRTDVVEALKNIKLPVLRWPGGCFADEYHWKDGIGPKENRKKMINTHWGGVVEDNSFGTHEFLELCRQIGCEPYINGNVGSGTVQEMSEWMEYMTFDGVSPMAALRAENGHAEPWKVKYFGVGNESWGCGGNMRPSYYADLYRRFQTYVRDYGENKVFRIACGPNTDDYNWTEEVMRIAGGYMDGLSLHYYTVPGDWNKKGSATDFDEAMYYHTLKKAFYMDELVTKHAQIMDRYDPEHKVGLIVDEWGTWFDVEPGTNPGFLYQQSTMRDAMVAALTLNIFNAHSDRVAMANIAQLVNVLQAVILTEGEKWRSRRRTTCSTSTSTIRTRRCSARLLKQRRSASATTPCRTSAYRPPRMMTAPCISRRQIFRHRSAARLSSSCSAVRTARSAAVSSPAEWTRTTTSTARRMSRSARWRGCSSKTV